MTAPRILAQVFADGAQVIAALIPLLNSGANDEGGGEAVPAQADPGADELAILEDVLLTARGQGLSAPNMTAFPPRPCGGTGGGSIDDLALLMEQVEAAARRIALIHAEKTLSLHRFGHAFLSRYRMRKSAWRADFDDLIELTALLSENSMAWVLFRLDGGIDLFWSMRRRTPAPRNGR